MLRIVLINELPYAKLACAIEKSKELELAAVVTKTESAPSYQSKEIPVISMDEIDAYSPDIVLAFYYSRLIPASVFEKYTTVNVHAGILPMWRGFSSNAWAVINGEKEVGYTVHRVTGKFDDGDIYQAYKAPISDKDAYVDVRAKFEKDFLDDLERLLVGIHKGTILPVSQQGKPHRYTVRLRPSDGYITSWDKPSGLLFGIFHMMASTLGGTGVYFKVNEEWIEVTKMSRCPSYGDYMCIPGAVVFLTESGSAIIKTQDGVLSVDEVKKNGELCKPAQFLRNGMRL